MTKPLPLKPKKDKELGAKANKFAYLTKTERAWLAGLLDGCGRIFNARILKTANYDRLISYKIQIRSTQVATSGVEQAAKLLRYKLRDYSATGTNSGSGRKEVNVPYGDIDDLMAILKPYISAGKYNAYVRAKYLSELSEFKLGELEKQYQLTGRPKYTYKGIDWKQLDVLLAQPEITPALHKAIKAAQESTLKLVQ